MLAIPWWYAEAVWFGREINEGRLPMASISYQDYQLYVFAWSAHEGARAARKEAEDKKTAQLRALVARQ